MHPARVRLLVLAAACAAPLLRGAAADQPSLTNDEIRQFLLTAEVVKSRAIGKGVTGALRLTLTDGQLTHDAGFNTVEERKSIMVLQRRTEINFVDSYHYNIAAFAIAELLGLDHMMPVTVERAWQGRRGALSWWIETEMDEAERLKRKVTPPDPEAWNQQMYRMRVFSRLVHDTDRHLGNVMISSGWKLWMMDFTRAFRLTRTLDKTADLPRCDRRLLDALRALKEADVKERTKPHLTQWEIEAMFARRDAIVAHFERLVAEKGEAAVLY
jgi:hypothetical protein